MLLEYFLLGALLFGLAVTFVYCGITGISPIPTSRTSRKAIFAALPPKPEGDVLELGAGWGALAFPLARRFPQNTVVAYELSPVPWLYMKLRWFLTRRRNLIIRRRNFLKADLSTAGLVVCYLHPKALEKLAPKLKQELHADAQVISNTFEFPGWIPTVVNVVDDFMCPHVFIYRVGSVAEEIAQVLPLF